jgi:MATE family multidrug resistance protein
VNDRRDLWRLAVPAALAMVVRSLFRINDQYFVQQLGLEAQAAVAVGGMVAIWFVAFGEMVGVGTLAVTARRFGEGDHERAHATIRTALRVAVAVGLVLAVSTVSLRHAIGELLIPGEAAARERGFLVDYLFWIAIGQIVMAVMPALDASFMAMKNARVPLLLEGLAVATNAGLNGWLVPVLGVEGAGLATALSRGPVLLLGAFLLRAAGVALLGTTSLPIARRVLVIGIPTCAAIALYSAVYQTILAVTFPHFGARGRSALGAGFGIESVFYCAYWGVGYAVGSLVGRALGEGSADRAAAIARLGRRANLAIGVGCGIAFWTVGPTLVGILVDDPVAFDANIEYLRYMSFAQPFQAVGVVFEQVLAGSGLTTQVLLSTGTMNLARIPLAHLLAVVAGLGLPGVWCAINLSSLGKCAFAAFLFRRGRWRTHRV